MRTSFTLALFLTFVLAPAKGSAQDKAALARETAEFVSKKFGKEAVEGGVEGLSHKIEKLVLKNGDDALVAVRKVGPRTFHLVEGAGEHGPAAVKLLARHGDAAVWVVSKRERLTLFVKHGDSAAEAMIKHGEIAEPLIRSAGPPAAGAFNAVSTRNGRRLAIVSDQGNLTAMGHILRLLAVIEKHGDRAMEFIWSFKAILAKTEAMLVFLANPEPYLDGTVDITQVGDRGDSDVGTAASAQPPETEGELVRFVACGIGILVLCGGIGLWARRRARKAKPDRSAGEKA